MKLKYILAALMLVFAMPARAELRIDVSGAERKALPIAIPEMIGNNGNFFTKIIGNDYGDKIREVLAADLDRSGLFKVLPTNSYIETLTSIDQQPKFVNWQAIKSQALVQSQIVELPGDKIRVDFRLWDVTAEQQLIGKSFTTTKSNWRRIAHVVADAIYERLTGEVGYFDTQIVFIAETGPVHKRVKRMAIMDQDGYGMRYLSDMDTFVMSPHFSPNMQSIVFLSYYKMVIQCQIFSLFLKITSK